MCIDEPKRVAEKLRVQRSPGPRQRNWTDRSRKRDNVRELPRLWIRPVKDIRGQICSGQHYVVIIYCGANIRRRWNQPGRGGKGVLSDFHGNLIMSSASS